MKREEAIKRARVGLERLKTNLGKSEWGNGIIEAFETIIPELKESEDERIIKTLQEYVKSRNWNLGGPTQDEVLAWLEKQKEQKSLNISAASEWLREHVSAYMNSEYNEFHKCIEYDGSIDKERFINDFEEAMQRGQKPIINIDQLKSLMLQYLQEAANEKDDSDIEADTDKWARKILGYVFEQKPTWSDEDEAHRDFILESLEDQIRFCKKDAEGANYAKQIRTAQNWVKSIPERFNIQPKPECDNETEVQKAYREGKNAGRKEVFDHPEYYGLQLRRMYDYETGEKYPFVSYKDQLQKPWEWGEEETKILNSIIDDYEAAAKSFCGYDGKIGLLRAIRDGAYNLPKSGWSEEDKEWLSDVYFAIDHSMYSEDERQAMKKYIDSLRSQAKLKQERNEEDEKVRKWLLEYFYLHRDDLRGASVTSMEVLSFLDKHPGKENACDAHEFDPKPGEKFWVRCKTNKTVNLWFDKDDERPAYAVDADGIITYIVHIKKDGTGNCVSYQDKEKFLETFEIIEKR